MKSCTNLEKEIQKKGNEQFLVKRKKIVGLLKYHFSLKEYEKKIICGLINSNSIHSKNKLGS